MRVKGFVEVAGGQLAVVGLATFAGRSFRSNRATVEKNVK
jgi:hypothetical protein